MLDFPTKSLNSIKKYLLSKQREVKKNLREVEKDDPATTPFLAETSESGTDSWVADEHTKIVVVKEQLKKISSSIKNALIKIRKGDYGKCERCGKQIEIGRLLAMPTATLCLSCSKKVSK